MLDSALGAASLTLLPIPVSAFFFVIEPVVLVTRPPSAFSPPTNFLARGVALVERGLRGFLSVVTSSLEIVELDSVIAPRGGAAGRSPDSISARSFWASFRIIRKRPSIAS